MLIGFRAKNQLRGHYCSKFLIPLLNHVAKLDSSSSMRALTEARALTTASPHSQERCDPEACGLLFKGVHMVHSPRYMTPFTNTPCVLPNQLISYFYVVTSKLSDHHMISNP
jgi:hypothetical protein